MSKLKGTNNYVYSFTVEDKPKYKKLIDFLENIDTGARAYIIRQILQNYVESGNQPLPFIPTVSDDKIEETEEIEEETKVEDKSNALKSLKNKFG